MVMVSGICDMKTLLNLFVCLEMGYDYAKCDLEILLGLISKCCFIWIWHSMNPVLKYKKIINQFNIKTICIHIPRLPKTWQNEFSLDNTRIFEKYEYFCWFWKTIGFLPWLTLISTYCLRSVGLEKVKAVYRTLGIRDK